MGRAHWGLSDGELTKIYAMGCVAAVVPYGGSCDARHAVEDLGTQEAQHKKEGLLFFSDIFEPAGAPKNSPDLTKLSQY